MEYELQIKVRDYEVDSQGIVNNANYLHYLEITRHDFCEHAGTSFREMQEKGLDPVVRKIEIEYLSSLTLGETMISRLSMRREGARFIFVQDIYNAVRSAGLTAASSAGTTGFCSIAMAARTICSSSSLPSLGTVCVS